MLDLLLEINKKKSDFMSAQLSQQAKGQYPVVKSGNSFVWTINDFPGVDFFARTFTSPLFEYQGSIWRMKVSMYRKSAPPNYRTLDFELEIVEVESPEITAKLVDISVASRKFHTGLPIMNPNIRRTLNVNLGTMDQVYNELGRNNSLKLTVLFH